MTLQDILFTQGFGTRRICAGLVQQGHVAIAGNLITDALAEVDANGLVFEVDGVAWPYCEKAYVMLNKPAGTWCSFSSPSSLPLSESCG